MVASMFEFNSIYYLISRAGAIPETYRDAGSGIAAGGARVTEERFEIPVVDRLAPIAFCRVAKRIETGTGCLERSAPVGLQRCHDALLCAHFLIQPHPHLAIG